MKVIPTLQILLQELLHYLIMTHFIVSYGIVNTLRDYLLGHGHSLVHSNLLRIHVIIHKEINLFINKVVIEFSVKQKTLYVSQYQTKHNLNKTHYQLKQRYTWFTPSNGYVHQNLLTFYYFILQEDYKSTVHYLEFILLFLNLSFIENILYHKSSLQKDLHFNECQRNKKYLYLIKKLTIYPLIAQSSIMLSKIGRNGTLNIWLKVC